MTDLTKIDLNAQTTVALRKLASQAGVKGMGSARKETVLAALMMLQDRQNQEAAKASKPAKGKCEICRKRPVMPAAKMNQTHGVVFPYCEPCLIEANWENTHSDEGHEDGVSGTVDECWICHPELNEAQREYVEREGTSRAGMKMNVTAGQRPEDKAKVVTDAAASVVGFETKTAGWNGGQYSVTVRTDFAMVSLSWDRQGRYVYVASRAEMASGKVRKVRNVSEAIAFLAGTRLAG